MWYEDLMQENKRTDMRGEMGYGIWDGGKSQVALGRKYQISSIDTVLKVLVQYRIHKYVPRYLGLR